MSEHTPLHRALRMPAVALCCIACLLASSIVFARNDAAVSQPADAADIQADNGTWSLSYESRVIGQVRLRKVPAAGHSTHDLFYLVNLQGQRYFLGPPSQVSQDLAAFLQKAWQEQKPVTLAGRIAEHAGGQRWLLAEKDLEFGPAPDWYASVAKELAEKREQARKQAEARAAKVQGTLMKGARPISASEMQELEELFSSAGESVSIPAE